MAMKWHSRKSLARIATSEAEMVFIECVNIFFIYYFRLQYFIKIAMEKWKDGNIIKGIYVSKEKMINVTSINEKINFITLILHCKNIFLLCEKNISNILIIKIIFFSTQ